jgi:hypothetical protein
MVTLVHGARTLWHVAHLFGHKPAPSMPMRMSFGEEATLQFQAKEGSCFKKCTTYLKVSPEEGLADVRTSICQGFAYVICYVVSYRHLYIRDTYCIGNLERQMQERERERDLQNHLCSFYGIAFKIKEDPPKRHLLITVCSFLLRSFNSFLQA